MAKIVVIADDLTGAADCAAACASHGISAAVLLHPPRETDSYTRLPDTEILSIDADTRRLSPEQASQTTAELVRLCRTSGALGSESLLFKKLDSTLRGHVATELAAVLGTRGGMAAGQSKLSIIMAPALPAQGRSTIGGRQMLHGRPLEKTTLWNNEARAPQSEILAPLAEAGLSCRLIEAAKVRSGLNPLREAMMRLAPETDVILCDAETDDDLRAIAEASIALGQQTIWAGSAGLAWHLPHAAGMMKTSADQPTVSLAPGPALFVVGSPASISHQQAKMLAALPEVVTVQVAPASLLTSLAPTRQIIESLQSGRDVLIVLDRNGQCSDFETKRITRNLAKVIGPCANFLGALVATGGETARAILDELGICRLRLLGQVEPGLPFSAAEQWTRPLPILTKAGGFGSAETLVHCRRFLQRLDRTHAQTTTQSVLGRTGS